MELPCPEKNRALSEKETFKYMGLLKDDTIKQVEMKEKIKSIISGEPENYSTQSYQAGSLLKG